MNYIPYPKQDIIVTRPTSLTKSGKVTVDLSYKYWRCVCGCENNFQSDDVCLRCKKRRIYVLVEGE
jgi:hypothetical protein